MTAPWRACGAFIALVALMMSRCSSGPPGPAPLDTRNDACSHCRMPVSDARLAGQIVAPGEEPRFFDDLGCLREFLAAHPDLDAASRVFVADFDTRAWTPAALAAYYRDPRVDTPMGSHVIAFAKAESARRGEDAVALSAGDVFGRDAVVSASR